MSRDNDSFYAGVLLWSSATFVVVGMSLVILGWRGGVFREPEQSAVVTNAPTVGEATVAASDRGHPGVRIACGDGIRNPSDAYDDANWRFPTHADGTVGSSAEAGRGARED
jgi:hypothetical protein